MKKRLSFHYITLFIFCQALALLTSVFPASAASVNNFYFESFTADYYVSKGEDGAAKMHVKEELVAVFPNYDQNHGIIRTIPYLNADGKNVTVSSQDALNLKVTRNGQPEHIYDVSTKAGGLYAFTIRHPSDDIYVHGRQTYVLEYDFDNVVLHYDSAGNVTWNEDSAISSELYWDTNGTGWPQSFGALTARVHFTDDLLPKISSATSCYVGTEGTKGNSSRCTTTKLPDGFEFEASSLGGYENLTFDIPIEAGTFTIIAKYNYTLILLTIVFASATFGFLVAALKSLKSTKEKRVYFKNCPTPPQYLPPKNLSLSELTELSLKPTKSRNVAILMKLAVDRRIELVKGEKKFFTYKWSINVKNLQGISSEEASILKILNGGELPANNSSFEIKTQRYSSALAQIEKDVAKTAKKSLVTKHLFEVNKKGEPKVSFGPIIAFGILFILFYATIFILIGLDNGGIVIGGTPLGVFDALLFLASIVVICIYTSNANKYSSRTRSGLEAAVYLNGLQLYLKMAEADRLAILQSVKGADTSPTGVVKIYEKLLPYAILFGVEGSWLEELNKYYEAASIEPTWYVGTGAFAFSDFNSFSASAGSSMSSGSGSSSSSGSGGGGSSGGGGGGGGGGGC